MFKKNKADLSESNRQCFLLTTQNASFLSEGFSNCSLSVVFVDFLSFWFLLSGLWRVLSNLMPSSTRLICNTTQFNRGPSRKSRFFPSVVRSACEDVAHNRQSQMHVCMYACMQVLALY